MDETPGVSDQYRMASPWPVFVAVGFVLTELGLFIGLFPVAVAGVLLLGGSVSGILTESGYVSHLWKTLATVGAAFTLLGFAAIVAQGAVTPGPLSAALGADALVAAVDAPNAAGSRLSSRGLSVGLAGVILVSASVAGHVS